MGRIWHRLLRAIAFFGFLVVTCADHVEAASTGFHELPGFSSPPSVGCRVVGNLAGSNWLNLSLGLPVRDPQGLKVFIHELYDPKSPLFHHFLTPGDFLNRYGPTATQYACLAGYAVSNGLTVVRRHSNRLVLDVAGKADAVQRAFHVHLYNYQRHGEAHCFYAPDVNPSVPNGLALADVWGLNNERRPRPQVEMTPAGHVGRPAGGSAPGGNYWGADFRHAYVPGSALTGTGQKVALVEFDGYYAQDISNYEARCFYPPVPLTNVLLDSVSGVPGFSQINNAVLEVSLDIELTIAMAPGISNVTVYEGISPYDVYNAIATDNQARQVSSSWLVGNGPMYDWTGSGGTLDSILMEMAAQGQAFFQASGDTDAYTGAGMITGVGGPIPVDSPYVTSVGGTSLVMGGQAAGYESESAWNWGGNTGTSGGISTNYVIPTWQAAVPMTNNMGSSSWRNIPDVALTADSVYVLFNNGSETPAGGTSCAAPLWAGFCALVNQQAAGTEPGGTGPGFLNPALYTIGLGSNAASCFHDVISGNNVGTNTPGLFYAVPGYDLCTGLGTPAGTNLINALAPLSLPFFMSQPQDVAATNGAAVELSTAVQGAPGLFFQWQFDGTNLVDGGNVTGSESNNLAFSSITSADAGFYSLVVTNVFGSITSSVAFVQVGFAPSITVPPTGQTVSIGSQVQFQAQAAGSAPLSYEWLENGSFLAPDHSGLIGSSSNLLALDSVSPTNNGNYQVIVTNLFGVCTSSIAALFVYQPPVIVTSLPPGIVVQCGSNNPVFQITALGSPAPAYQWFLDGNLLAGETRSDLNLTNLAFSNHLVQVVASNSYGSATNFTSVTVEDTLPPAVLLNGFNPMFVELGGTFMDPGATALDLCAGSLPVSILGSINTSVVGTNYLTYTATDPSSNSASVVREVIVRDTTPPSILYSFTNLTLTATTNCSVSLPDLTGTNYIGATDLSLPLTIKQEPVAGTALSPGTYPVLLSVSDAYGNTSHSTNSVTILDGEPPQILLSPMSQTNQAGMSATFQVAASACTPMTFQWYKNNMILTGAITSSLVFTNLVSTQTGGYSVEVLSSGGSVTSSIANLMVTPQPSQLMISSSSNPAGYLVPLTFNGQIIPVTGTGQVQWFTNGSFFQATDLTNGIGETTGGAILPRGTNIILAIYSGDANTLGCTNQYQEWVTNHPPTALPVTVERAAGTILELSISNLARYWSDTDGDPVQLAEVTTSTNGVILNTNTPGWLGYENPLNVNDQFICVVSDGMGGTNDQIVSIQVVFPGLSEVLPSGMGPPLLIVTGVPGQAYVLQAASNLAPPIVWQPLVTNILDVSGTWQYGDPGAAQIPQRFYRIGNGP